MFGKTKFPGKPSKLVHKKRVSVLSFDNNFDKRASDHCENDDGKNLASQNNNHGFQSETTTTTSAAQQSSSSSTASEESGEEKSKPVMTTTSNKSVASSEIATKQSTDKSENNSVDCDNSEKHSRTTNTKKRVTFRATPETSDQCKVKHVYNPNYNNGHIKSIIKKESLKYPILVYKSKCIVQPSRFTEIAKDTTNNIDKLNSLRFGREYANQQANTSTDSEECAKEPSPSTSTSSSSSLSNVIVASKFNLPKISTNSSRIIKPNKRFLDSPDETPSAVKKKVIKASFWGEGGDETKTSKKTSNLSNNSFGFNFVDEIDFKPKKKSSKERKESSSNEPKTSPTSILRKPVLQLSTTFGLFGGPQSGDAAIKSPFSLKLNSSSSSNLSSSIFTTSLVCHVCNSITTRKQPRKYGAVCCELCRKFMSRMIEKVNKNPACSFQCDKSDGNCSITPSTIKSHKSLKAQKLDLKVLSRGRCYACWLRKCLQNFQLPAPVTTRLNNVLPKTLAEPPKPLLQLSTESSNPFMSSLKFPTFKLTSNLLAVNNFTFGSKPDLKPAIDNALKSTFALDKPLQVEIPKEPTTAATTTQEVVKKSPKSPLKTSPKKENPSSPSTSQTVAQAINPANVATSDALRQRLLLKGPRVKHVCRSASLVLGQPIAVFPGDENQENLEMPVIEDNLEKENLPVVEEKENNVKDDSTKETDEGVNVQLQVVKRNPSGKPATRKVTRPQFSQNFDRISSSKPSKRFLFHQPMIRNINQPPMISIDFWENYDPAEVSRTGFGLILSEKTPIKSLCFLCGSCGSDPLIFCVCCCEPYHYYCVEDEFNIRFRVNNFMNESSDSLNISSALTTNDQQPLSGYEMPLNKRLNWLCPRCTVCYTCNMSTGAKVKCQKCEKNYHTTCLGTSKRLLGADRPMICSSCLKCKSCGTTNVTKFIGNLPMCSNCFRLRRKGNFCPLCQKCYENNDYDVKMMECGDCRRWVHSKCEGLADEQYNLLSVLPEHIEFVCKKCSPSNASANVWRDSVESEFKNSLLSVIKMLSKSRHACVLLRLSPRKRNSHCSCRLTTQTLPESFNSLFDALKTEEAVVAISEPQCKCHMSQIDLLKPSINSIKQNIHDGRYNSLQAFNFDMNKILTDAQSEELVITYNEIISEIFPWYQNETKACTDALEETMNDHSKEDLLDELMNESENCDFMMIPTPNLSDTIPKDEEIHQRFFFSGKDTRSCMLCKRESDFPSQEEGRLLYCGNNTWVHTNCALWSAEVYEEIDGSLQNVHSAISRGRMIKCGKCGLKGATVGCNYKNCGEQYHFKCARTICEFGVDKRVFCPQHLSKVEDTRQLETNFEVNRSVYVELDRKKKKSIEASKVQFLIGSLCVTKLGRIVPMLSDYGDFLVPIDFECTRLYWSSRQPWNIVEYKIKISIQRSNLHPLMTDKGINFTVDHSKADQMIQHKLKKISMFHNSILKEQEMMIVQEETQDEEPQNNNDLFPPEIKQAIFEDLPHDVLDGISMFDIFPKDSADSKATFYNHVLDEDDDNSKSNQVNGDDDLNGFLNEFADDLNFTRKVGGHDDPENKKRKLNSGATNSNDTNNNQGSKSGEKSASSSKVLLVKESKIPQLDGLNDEMFDGPVACDRCRCTYRNRTSFDRHLSTCENIQNSNESDNELQDSGNQVFHLKTTTSQQSITGLGNNNVISMINQQQNQSMATSIPIVINPFGQTATTALSNGGGAVQIPNISLAIGNDGNLCQNVIVDQQGQQIYAQPIQLGSFNQPTTIMPLRNFNQTTNVINNGNIQYINTSQQQPTQFIQLAPSNSSSHQQLMITSQSVDQQQDQQKISNKKPMLLPSPSKGKGKTSMSGMQVVKSTTGTLVNGKKKMETMSTKTQQQISIVNSKNIQIANYQSSTASTNNTQTIQQPSAQNIIFQQPTQQNYPLIINQNGQIIQCISADNQNGSQIQYIGTSKDVKNSSQTFITNPQQNSSPQIFSPNSFQMQSNNSTGNLVLTPNGLSVLPVQQPIVGTIIQQPQTLQCVNGVMSAEQMMLGQTPTLEMDPTSGCMYLTTQPVYYGLETIVQNTVMSSQQFVSTAAMQGICQNSSFSATTTQVFQASKIEPIQMDIPTGYVFLNNDGTIHHQPQIMDSSSATWNIVEDKKSTEISNFGSQKSQNVIVKSATSVNAKQKVQPKINKIQPQIINKIVPTTSQQPQQVLKTINENPQQNIQVINANVMAKKPQKQANYRTIGPKLQQEDHVKSPPPPPPTSAAYIKPKVQAKPIHVNNITIKPAEVTQKPSIESAFRTTVQNNNINNNALNKPKIEASPQPTIQTTVINLPPTNVVTPIFKQNSSKSSFQNRPTNRVLPMQAASGGVKANKIGNIVKGNGTSGSAGNNLSSNISSPPLVNNNNHHTTTTNNHHITNNNNAVIPPVQNEISENYCEKIKSIAMELQSSKADELFDALRRSTTPINNVITVTSNDFYDKLAEKKMKASPPRVNDLLIPSTSSPSNVSNKSPAITTKTAATECSLTKTINSVATGENLIESLNATMEITPSITITPIEKKIESIETILAELPELKPEKENGNVEEMAQGEEEQEDEKSTEKTFQPFDDEDTTSDQPSMSSNSAFATKSSREKTPTSTTSSKMSGPKILIEIQSQDGFTYKSTSISEVWEKLFETVQLARKAHGLMPLPEGRLNEMTGDQMLGLKTNPLKYLLEQLPGVEKCTRYSPKYHRQNSSASSTSSNSSFSSMSGNCSSMSGFYGTNSSSFSSNVSNLSSNSHLTSSMNQYISDNDEILCENFYGCGRFEPFTTRSEYDMFSWLASRHRLPPMNVHLQSNNDEVILRRGTGSNLPMAMKYRTLKETYKKSVGVYRSHIHGRGLFCTRDIEAGEMVIEYAGELIRSTLTDKRERYYDSKGIGCYMFKIDDNLVVDATMSGTAARFINHSCDPNCYSKVVDILGRKHIIIFALRRIVTGEELTYDYKFDIEDNKIPCCCGAKRCRKYMN